jgi:hypothetical protein
MRPKANRRIVYLTAFVSLLILCAASASEAGPILRRSIEMSNARSQPECGGQVAKILKNLSEQGNQLTVSKNNDSLATTQESTVGLECILVGRTQDRQEQWIIYRDCEHPQGGIGQPARGAAK